MKLKLILTTAIVGMAWALPSAAIAAPPPPPPTQDSVSLTEAPAIFGDFFTVEILTATSGPSGENPTGEISLNNLQQIFDHGPITCLAVSGNTATLNYVSAFLPGMIVTARVVDDNPDTFSIPLLGRAATDCSPPPETNVHPLTSGDVTVVDAQPLPTMTDQCRSGGWQEFGFRNQGQCIAFVNHGP